MSIDVTIETVLLESHLPDLVLARDVVGTPYLCCLTSRTDVGDHFIGVPVSVGRLAQFRAGRVDLRTVLVEPELGVTYAGTFDGARAVPKIRFDQVRDIPDAWLPRAGFLLTTVLGQVVHSDSDVVSEAVARRAAYLVCSFNPPEARDHHKMDADHLAEGVKSFQALVKYALKKTWANLPVPTRRAMSPDAHVIQATAFAAGSFEVHFESKHRSDLFGRSPVGQAMPRVDELIGMAGMALDQQLPILRQNSGHTLSALRRLMRFIAVEGAEFTYEWADPGETAPSGRRVTSIAADALCTIIDNRQELTAERVTFVGRFVRVAEDKGTWQAEEIGSGVTRRGDVDPEVSTILQGVRITEQLYRFVCDERIEETSSGKTIANLSLVELDPE